MDEFWENETETDSWDLEPADVKELFEATDEEEYSFEGNEDIDDVILDIDYSEFKGDFKSSIGRIKHKIKRAPRKKKLPLSREYGVFNKERVTIKGARKQIDKIVVPSDREVTIEGVSDFILSHDHDEFKNIGYYKGKKLKELIVSINNTNGVDFDLELFNPSDPLNYLFNTSGNLNDRVKIAGDSRVSYTDLLHNLLANPTLIANARFVVTGTNVAGQKNERLTFVNKAIDGESTVNPLSLALNFDLMQQQNDVILFDIVGSLNRVYIPDGMDIIQYRVLAGNTVTFCFYYKQKSLKKFFFKEARKKTNVLGEIKELL